MINKAFRFGRAFGMDFYLEASAAILVALTMMNMYVYMTRMFNHPTHVALVAGFLYATGLFISIFLHELGHAFAGKVQGLEFHYIKLHVIGGEAGMSRHPKSGWEELTVALAGPVVSLLIGIACLLCTYDVRPETATVLQFVVQFIGATNIGLAIFNMLPVYPMDGGRVLKGITWMMTKSPGKATRVACRVSMVCSVVMMCNAVASILGFGLWGGTANGIIMGLIGWTMFNYARREYDNVTGPR